MPALSGSSKSLQRWVLGRLSRYWQQRALSAYRKKLAALGWRSGLYHLFQLKVLYLKLMNEAGSLKQLWDTQSCTSTSTSQILGRTQRKQQEVGL